MQYFSQLIFAILLLTSLSFFLLNIRKIIRNINLGIEDLPANKKNERWKKMLLVAIGQKKMFTKPIAGISHIVVYIGFFIVNIEILEIIIDGLFGTHRFFKFFGFFYNFLIASFEFIALLVITSIFIFWIRRNLIKIKRFFSPEMKGWPKKDANLILYMEFTIMWLFLIMNASDYWAYSKQNLSLAGSFPISKELFTHFQYLSINTLHTIERITWWSHIAGIFLFLNYLYYSKHLHVLTAFHNVWHSKITPAGTLQNLDSIKKEVKLMTNPDIDPYAIPEENSEIQKFGAEDVFDLDKIQLLNSYTCTECGRCTASCPANLTGKSLSPRKIMMNTRDRLEEVGKNIDRNSHFVDDGKKLLGNYIKEEEIWACTSCNACTEACPISIDPLSIILKMRQFIVMEKASAPSEINHMIQNIENKGTPWQFNNSDRLDWVE